MAGLIRDPVRRRKLADMRAWKRSEIQAAARELSDEVTPEQRWLFLLCLAEGYTDADSARAVGRSIVRLRRLMREDEAFAASVAEAQAAGTAVMESEATRRGVEGVDEPVYYMGDVVGYKRVYSDSLLQFVLRARDPDRFKERKEVETVDSRDIAERLRKAREAARQRRADLGREEEVVEGEYREVDEEEDTEDLLK